MENENNKKLLQLIEEGNKYINNKDDNKLKEVYEKIKLIQHNNQVENELSLFLKRKKDFLDAKKNENKFGTKYPSIEKINEELNKLYDEKKYSEGLIIVNKYQSVGIKHYTLIYYRGLFNYYIGEYRKANTNFEKYSMNGYAHILECLKFLTTINIKKRQYKESHNFLQKYGQYYTILKDGQYNKDYYILMRKLLQKEKGITDKKILMLETRKEMLKQINYLLTQHKIKAAFNIVDNFTTNPLQLAKLKLKIIKYLYKNNLKDMAQQYYKDILKTENKDKELIDELNNFQKTIKLYRS